MPGLNPRDLRGEDVPVIKDKEIGSGQGNPEQP